MRLKKVFDYMLSSGLSGVVAEDRARTDREGLVREGPRRSRCAGSIITRSAEVLDEMLINLELFARLGLINRYPLLMSHLEWLQAQQAKDGRWNLPTRMLSDNSLWTNLLRIEKDWRSPKRKEADVTFRVLLILRLPMGAPDPHAGPTGRRLPDLNDRQV